MRGKTWLIMGLLFAPIILFVTLLLLSFWIYIPNIGLGVGHFIAILLLSMVIIIYGLIKNGREARGFNEKNFQILAKELNLQYSMDDKGYPRLAGETQGYPVEIYCEYVRIHNRGGNVYPHFRMRCLRGNEVPLEVSAPDGIAVLLLCGIVLFPILPFILLLIWNQRKNKPDRRDMVTTSNAAFMNFLFGNERFVSLWQAIKNSKSGRPSGKVENGVFTAFFQKPENTIGYLIAGDAQRNALRDSVLACVEIVRCLDEYNRPKQREESPNQR